MEHGWPGVLTGPALSHDVVPVDENKISNVFTISYIPDIP